MYVEISPKLRTFFQKSHQKLVVTRNESNRKVTKFKRIKLKQLCREITKAKGTIIRRKETKLMKSN